MNLNDGIVDYGIVDYLLKHGPEPYEAIWSGLGYGAFGGLTILSALTKLAYEGELRIFYRDDVLNYDVPVLVRLAAI
jgi:hypothetical protein